MKRIVVCCDGTWNDPSKPKQTNVSKLKNAILQRGPDQAATEQRVHYVDGVGVRGSLWDRLRGGALGYGLDDNVQKAYQLVSQDYEPGDEIYLFGFSRGAYTARSALGMIRKCGILKHVSAAAVRRAWDHYRDALHPEHDESKRWRLENALLIALPENYVPVAKFIGIWDTVGSLGIPIKQLREPYNFHDVTLTSRVDNAYHALAIDEQRKDYEPTLWARSESPRPEQQFEQRWFAGVHSDIGGGAAHEGFDAQSDHCLQWILDKAVETGLEVDRDAIDWHQAPESEFPRLHLDQGLLFRLIALIRKPARRPIGKGVREGKEGHGRPSNETVDDEAILRLKQDRRYNPKNLRDWVSESS